MRWPWSRRSVAAELRDQVAERGRAEIERRRQAAADEHLKETGRRIAEHWAAGERAIVARRVAAALTFAAHLAPARREIQPLQWRARG